jgi:hypothetical protein
MPMIRPSMNPIAFFFRPFSPTSAPAAGADIGALSI